MDDGRFVMGILTGLVIFVIIVGFGSMYAQSQSDVAREECRACAGPCPSWPVTDPGRLR